MEFKFINKTISEEIEGNKIILKSGEKTDYFCSYDYEAKTTNKIFTAPFMYTEVQGDFVASVKATLDFKDTYDSAVLMLMEHDLLWAKACFELTDFGKTAAVSVVTNGVSDDANGANVTAKEIYLKAVRVKNDFSFHYSLDGKNYEMMRFFHLEMSDTIKVGMASQSPLGNGTTCIFHDFKVENITVKNIRKGE